MKAHKYLIFLNMFQPSFSFGKNWEKFSREITPEQLEEARCSLEQVLGPSGLHGKTFLDIGCGSGLFSICAFQMGARRVVGIDVDRECIEVSRRNARRFIQNGAIPDYVCASILDSQKMSQLGEFDVVYAWGSLHHTGAMWKAIENSSGLVKNGGILWLAIYNRHFTSGIWKKVKKLFNRSPRELQNVMIHIFGGFIMVRFIVAFRNPFRTGRGMKFFSDVRDWIGGYPYEYASRKEISEFLTGMGFTLSRVIPTSGFTGCNQYVAGKKGES